MLTPTEMHARQRRDEFLELARAEDAVRERCTKMSAAEARLGWFGLMEAAEIRLTELLAEIRAETGDERARLRRCVPHCVRGLRLAVAHYSIADARCRIERCAAESEIRRAA